jgi:hypothetical protein
MLSEGTVFYFTSASSISQLLKLLLIWMSKTFKRRSAWQGSYFYCINRKLKGKGKEYWTRKQWDEGTKWIKASENGIINKDTKEIIPHWISKGLSSISHVKWRNNLISTPYFSNSGYHQWYASHWPMAHGLKIVRTNQRIKNKKN